MEKHILVLDVGTTNIKAIIFKRDGTIASETVNKTPYIIEQEGQVEQDPLEIWKLSSNAIEQAFSQSGLRASDVAVMGISTQRSSFCLWDKKTGKPSSNIITWQDKRAAAYADKKTGAFPISQIRATAKVVTRVVRTARLNLYSILKFDTVHSSVRTGYLLENNPELRSAVMKPDSDIVWGTIDTWLLWNLTSGRVHATDYSCASSTGLIDPFSLEWNDIVLGLFGIPRHILPELKETIADYGTTSLFGGGEIKIGAIVADQQASLFGQCCFGYGDLKCTNGTGSFVDINTGNKPFASLRRLYPLVAWRINGITNYMLEGQSQNAGNIVDWLANNLAMIKEPGDSETLAFSVPSSNGVSFIPAFTTGLTFPYWDSTVKGNVFGITLDTNVAHIVRAVLEGISFRIKDIVDGITLDTGIKPTKLKCDGGVSRNRFIRQFLADILGFPVEYTSHPETTALGAAFLAGLSSGFYRSLDEIVPVVSVSDVCRPAIDAAERDKRYSVWKDVVKRSLRFQL